MRQLGRRHEPAARHVIGPPATGVVVSTRRRRRERARLLGARDDRQPRLQQALTVCDVANVLTPKPSFGLRCARGRCRAGELLGTEPSRSGSRTRCRSRSGPRCCASTATPRRSPAAVMPRIAERGRVRVVAAERLPCAARLLVGGEEPERGLHRVGSVAVAPPATSASTASAVVSMSTSVPVGSPMKFHPPFGCCAPRTVLTAAAGGAPHTSCLARIP